MTNTSKGEAALQSGVSGGTNVTVNNNGLSPGHPFYNVQGQKWQQVFDFEKVLKQLRSAEKLYLRGKGSSGESHSKSSSHANINASFANPSNQVIQVQRLNAQDMQFYDIAPKQTARDVVVCNACMGYFTKMGFNNHMLVHHPSIWGSTSNKINMTHTSDILNSLSSSSAPENSQDGIREVSSTVQPDVIGSPMDMSGIISNSSNGSSTSSSMLSPYTVVNASTSNSRHKSSSKSSSSKAGGSSSGSSRSRSKSKHHHNSSSSTPSSASSEIQHKNSGGNSKKSSSSASATAHITNSTSTSSTNVGIKDPSASIGVYSSSSSNSSCSLPSTPKIDALNAIGANGNIVGSLLDSNLAYSPATEAMHEKDKHTSENIGCASLIVSSKKKSKSPAVIAQESIDSSMSSTSSSDFDRTTTLHKTKIHPLKAAVKPISANQIPPYDSQLSELDQAVSSITSDIGSGVVGKLNQANEAITGIGVNQASTSYPQQVQMIQQHCEQEQIQQHNASDDNSISLSIDDMLDSGFINEMLNTAESEIPFDESALDPALQQPVQANYMQPPATKRMRYNDGSLAVTNEMDASGTNTASAELVGANYGTMYQQQQQQPTYDAGNLEEMKLYGNTMAADADMQQQQSQLTTIDAMQLQQLIYQQQQMLEAEQKQLTADGYNGVTYENQQIVANAVDGSGQQFNVYNVPSLTDDNINVMSQEQHQQQQQQQQQEQQLENMIMPNIIYDFTANNQGTVMDQQSQQQVIAEFLTQAGYDNMEQVLSGSTENAPSANMNNGNAIMSTDAGNGINTASWVEFNELSDIDFTKLETVSALSSNATNTNTTAAAAPLPPTSELKTVKQETNLRTTHTIQPHQRLTHTKYHEDFYFNVFLYPGIPRPIAVNTYGMLKLPQNLAVTFRKHLLTTRKANNSLLTLNGLTGVGGINGVIGGTAGVSRFPLSGIAKQNFYVSSTGVQGGSNNANEFSIGSITITNASGSSGVANIAQQTSLSGKNKTTSTTTTTPGTPSIRTPMPGIASKTIYVNKSCILINDRLKCVKRALNSKFEPSKYPVFTTKRIQEILNCNGSVNKNKEPPANADNNEQPTHEVSDIKSNRTQSFYERRRKLMLMSSSGASGLQKKYQKPNILRQQSLRQPPNHFITQKQRQEKLLNKQLVRTLSGNDLMRVFV